MSCRYRPICNVLAYVVSIERIKAESTRGWFIISEVEFSVCSMYDRRIPGVPQSARDDDLTEPLHSLQASVDDPMSVQLLFAVFPTRIMAALDLVPSCAWSRTLSRFVVMIIIILRRVSAFHSIPSKSAIIGWYSGSLRWRLPYC